MKVVIDIPESSLGLINDETTKIVYEAIRNGTVLPEGHGDLIERDTVLDMMNYGILEDNIESIPAIIEADKEKD